MPAIPPTTSGMSPFKAGHSDPFKPRIHGDNVPSRKGHGLDEGRMHPYEAVPGNLGLS